MGRYDPERLAAYRLAREHTREVRRLIEGAETRGFADVVENLRRCAASIPANIQEGYGEHRPKKKAHFYAIAKASVTEAWGHVDAFVDLGLADAESIAGVRSLQNQLIALLVTMIRTQHTRAEEEAN